jgi:hypothetical protein
VARRGDPGFRVIASFQDKFTSPIKRVNQQIAQSTAKLRALATLPASIGRAAGLDKIGSAALNVGRSIGGLRSSIMGLIGPFAQLGVAVGAIGMATMVKDAVGLGSELVKLSTITGVSVERLQELQYAAKQSDVDVGTFDSALKRLSKTIAAAQKGGKEQVAMFKAVGLSVADLKKLKVDEVFERVASAIANMSNETHRSETAMGAFGKSGQELLPVLMEGAWGLKVLAEEARATGLMTEDTARKSKEFGDIMTKVTQHIKGLSYEILGVLLPSMKDGAQGMDDWITTNKEWLTTNIVSVIRDIVDMARAFARIVTNDVVPAVAALRPVFDVVAGVIGKGNAMLLTFTAVVAPSVLVAIAGITKAVIGLGIALVANPIGAAIIAVVAAIGYAAYVIYNRWDEIVATFKEKGEQVVAAWDWVVSTVKAGFEKLTDLPALWDGVTAGLDSVGETITGALNAALDGALAILRTMGETIIAAARAIWQALVGDASDGLGSIVDVAAIFDGILSAVRSVGTAIIAAARAIWDLMSADVQDGLSGILVVITGITGALHAAIVSALTGPIEMVKGQWSALVSWLGGAWEKISGIFGGAARLVGLGRGSAASGRGGGGAGETAPAPPAGGWGGGRNREGAANDNPPLFGAPQVSGGAKDMSAASGPQALAKQQNVNVQSKSEVVVDFRNMPQGTTATEGGSTGNTEISLRRGYGGDRGALAGAY